MMARPAIHPLKIVAAVGSAFLLWGLVLAYASSPAQAATITVNSLADDGDGTDGECTLREAITSANTDSASGAATEECAAGSGDDVIDIGVTGTVNLTGELPILSTNIEIEGPGADQFTVRRDTGGDYRIFAVDGSVVSISGTTISNGKLENCGGGVSSFNGGTLTVTDSTISGNSSSFCGGGIFGGNVTVTDSTISDNSAGTGGGIYNVGGNVTVTDSTISDNSASLHSGEGGGIFNVGGNLTVTGSTISDNSASCPGCGGTAGAGGGIYTETDPETDPGLTTTITNSTISGNSSDSSTSGGGGVFNLFGHTVIEFSTITNNTAPVGATGGGVWSLGGALTRTEVLSTIISANTNDDVEGGFDDLVSKGHNIIGDGSATDAFNQTGDQTGVTDPGLDPLGFYGGPTQTHRLQSDSPAIDAGPPTDGDPIACPPPETDQRGVERPQGEACDAGAFELVQGPQAKADCKNGGYEEFGFKNQGQCISSLQKNAKATQ